MTARELGSQDFARELSSEWKHGFGSMHRLGWSIRPRLGLFTIPLEVLTSFQLDREDMALVEREGDLASRIDILLSVQRALLGAIGSEILAICVDVRQEEVEIVAFAEQSLSLTQREALQIVGTEVMADLASPIPVSVTVVEQAEQPLKCPGIWVFLRLHCLVQ